MGTNGSCVGNAGGGCSQGTRSLIVLNLKGSELYLGMVGEVTVMESCNGLSTIYSGYKAKGKVTWYLICQKWQRKKGIRGRANDILFFKCIIIMFSQAMQHTDLGSLTMDWTLASCSRRAESQPWTTKEVRYCSLRFSTVFFPLCSGKELGNVSVMCLFAVDFWCLLWKFTLVFRFQFLILYGMGDCPGLKNKLLISLALDIPL